eukprot:scaffold2.g7218.t1
MGRLAIILVALVAWASLAAAAVPEGELLLNLSANVSNWEEATSALPGSAWLNGTDPCGGAGGAAWKGVSCSGGNVTELRLPSLGLAGLIPDQLSRLQSLQVLDLHNNSLTGGRQPEGWLPPAWINPGTFPALDTLDLSANNITGCVDAVTRVRAGGGLDILADRALNLSWNRLALTLPPFWQSPTLQLLDLSHNGIIGSLPPSWGNRVSREQLTAFPALTLFNVSHNKLNGSVPDTWTGLSLFAANASVTLFPNALLSNTTADSGGGGSGGLSAGAIAGIAVGCAAAAAAAAGLAACALRRRREPGGPAPPASADSSVKAGDSGDLEKGLKPGKGPSGPPSQTSMDSARLKGGDGGGAAGAAVSRSALSGSGFTDDTAGGLCSEGRQGSGWRGSSVGTLDEGRSTDLSKLPGDWSSVLFSELELGRVIGEGSFGQVWVARWCQTTVAVKMLMQTRVPGATDSAGERRMLRQLQKEAAIMHQLRHPNVVSYLGACLDPPCLLMEYASKRSMDHVLSLGLSDPKVRGQLTWARLLSMAADAAKGMLYLHTRSPAIAHRDLKPANLLLDAQWHVKVSDFNLSRLQDPDELGQDKLTSTLCITNPRWLAPEVLSGARGDCASDVYSFGTVLWELATWQPPFATLNPFQIINTVQAAAAAGEGAGLAVPVPGELPAGPLGGYDTYVGLMRACWAANPRARPSMEEVATRLRALLAAELRQQGPAADRSRRGAVAGGGGAARGDSAGSAELQLPTPGQSVAVPVQTAELQRTESNNNSPFSSAALVSSEPPELQSAGGDLARPPPG